MPDRLRRVAIVLLFVGAEAGVISRSGAQTANDPDFHFRNPAPAFPTGTGPVVCVDEAHHNAHTLEGRFGPFAGVLRSDGFRVRSSRLSFTRAALEACDIQAFLPSDKIEPLLSFGPDAAAYVLLGEMGQQLEEVPEEEWPRFSVRGWLAGASRRWARDVCWSSVTSAGVLRNAQMRMAPGSE